MLPGAPRFREILFETFWRSNSDDDLVDLLKKYVGLGRLSHLMSAHLGGPIRSLCRYLDTVLAGLQTA